MNYLTKPEICQNNTTYLYYLSNGGFSEGVTSAINLRYQSRRWIFDLRIVSGLSQVYNDNK